MVEDLVEFNVGGKLFCTTFKTISFDKQSFLYQRRGSAHLQRDKNGAYFIDRDPRCFGIILNYLRLQTSNQRWETALPKEPDLLALLTQEAEYFRLSVLHDQAKALLQNFSEMNYANELLSKTTSFHQSFDLNNLNLKD
ncbi:hypothetical protein M3Y99_00880300 [Aphelenchoides fujianensis]|nr:hypothetical protein M3Y99_00880300 [Aphelenchoides fujianensis]